MIRRNSLSRVRQRRPRVSSRWLGCESLENRILLTAVRDVPGFASNLLPSDADASSGPVDIGFDVDFAGETYSQLFVNENGNITFETAFEGLPTRIGERDVSLPELLIPIVAPFWADVDAVAEGTVTYGTDQVEGRAAFGVNWNGVGYGDGNSDRLNDFQLVLIDRSDVAPGAFDVEFNYDQIQWETGDRSGGMGGLRGASARGGYANSTQVMSTAYELRGSGENLQFLDENILVDPVRVGLVHDSLRSDVDGRYLFPIRENPAQNFELDDIPPQSHLVEPGEYLTEPDDGDPLSIANRFLRANALSLGFSPSDLNDTFVTKSYTTSGTGTTHIYYQQTFNDLLVENALININVSDDGRITNVGSSLVAGLGLVAPSVPAPTIDAVDALVSLANHLGVQLRELPTVIRPPTEFDVARTTLISSPELSQDDIVANLSYVSNRASEVRLAWNFVVRLPDDHNWYDAAIDTENGDLLLAANWYRNASYNVFPKSVESPNHGVRTIEVDPSDPVASPFGWHDTNGAVGAEFTDTRGNNVFAQEDTNANNAGGARPDGGPTLDFDFPIDLTQAPASYLEAATTNLFYWNNLLHDIHYRYGFDEVSGNFQQNNYANGGVGGDPVQADVQDGSGLNNANFGTPPDGTDPRMQQYVFNSTNPNRDSDLESPIIIHEYGHGVSNRLTGGSLNSNALTCGQSRGMGEGWSDWWALTLHQEQADLQNDAYPLATYVLGQAITGAGIRSQPYSFDMTVNTLTFADIATQAPPHGIGEVWASALWDLNWILINKHGFDQNIEDGYSPGDGGNALALRLIMDGLKLQPANPTFLDARDAILQADILLTAGANQDEIWRAFARRGMGFSAVALDCASTDVIEAFDVPPPVADRFEPNDTLETATPLGSIPEVTLRDLTIHSDADVDYFKVTANQTGKLIVNSLFEVTNGDLVLEVRDMHDNVIARSSTSNDNETIVIPVVSQEMYFVRVFGLNDAVNQYTLEVENFAAPVPSGIHLDPASDTGMSEMDNKTADASPRLIVQADLADFDAMDIDVLTSEQADLLSLPPVNPNEPAVEAILGVPPNNITSGVAVEVFVTNSRTGQTISGFADPVGTSNLLFEFVPDSPLGDDIYFVSAATRVFDDQRTDPDGPIEGRLDPATGRTLTSQPLWMTIDTMAPNGGTIELLVSSDTGMDDDDNVTNKMSPAFAGLGEANAKVRVFAQPVDPADGPGARLLVGQGVVNSDNSDGDRDNGLGTWEVTVEPLADAKYNFSVEFEDMAGNIGTGQFFRLDPILPPAIPDQGTTTVDLEVAGIDADTLSKIQVEIDIRHGNTADLDVVLISPAGTRVELTTGNGDGADYVDTIFNDAAATSITEGTNPFTGIFRPEQPLSDLMGEEINGTWTLEVTDQTVDEISGAILNWHLTFESSVMVWIDTVAPNTPHLDLITVDDTGHSGVDDITNVSRPRIDLTFDDTVDGNGNPFPNDVKVRVYDRPGDAVTDGEVLIYDSFQEFGDFIDVGYLQRRLTSVLNDPIGLQLADGVHNLKMEVEDRAGNISHDFLRDLEIDTVTVVTDLDLIESSDTGMLDDDNVTSKMQPAFSGLGEEGATVRILARDVTSGTTEIVGEGLVGSDMSDDDAGNFAAVLTGGQEVTPVVSDAFGRASLELSTVSDRLLITIELVGLDLDGNQTADPSDDVVGLHIHRAAAGRNGPVVFGMINPNNDLNGDLVIDAENGAVTVGWDAAEGNGTTLLDELDDLLAGNLYFNVHTPENATGEIRGQILPIGAWEVTVEPMDDGVYDIVVEIEDGAGNKDRSDELRIEIDSIAPNTPFLDIDEESDSGRHNDDNITFDNTPNVSLTTHDANADLHLLMPDLTTPAADALVDYLKYRIYDRAEVDGVLSPEILLYDSAADLAADVTSTTIGQNAFFTSAVLPNVNNAQTTLPQLYTQQLGFDPENLSDADAAALAIASGGVVIGVDGVAVLADGFHNLKLEVEDRAGNISHDFLLDVLIDTQAPDGTVNLHPDSDTGIWGLPETMEDLVTSDKTPLLFGETEANALIRVEIDNVNGGIENGGTSVAVPLDGDDAFPPPDEYDGNYFLQTILNLEDGEHTIDAYFRDVAGNETPTPGDSLTIFVDTQGPRITNVTRGLISFDISNDFAEIDDDRETSLFDPKPAGGPDPLIHSIVIHFSDLPDRTIAFDDYDALAEALASEEGNYQLIGDANGNIPILQADVTFETIAEDGLPERAQVELIFHGPGLDGIYFTDDDLGAPLPDDRFSLWVSDTIADEAGNPLDGESGAQAPFTGLDGVDPEVPVIGPPDAEVDDPAIIFPTGDGEHGGDFRGRFTVDSRAELGVWAASSVWIDTNGNFFFDPQNSDYVNRDIIYSLAFTSDDIFAGNFSNDAGEDEIVGTPDDGPTDGFDKLAAYGRFGDNFRWLIDTDNDGVPNINQIQTGPERSINALPAAGNFDGNVENGDEVALFTGLRGDNGTWRLDTNHDFVADNSIAVPNMSGYPVVGDFDGDGADDLGSYTDDVFQIDFAADGFGAIDTTFRFGFIGVRERPIAADFDGDGIDDIGLWLPDRAGISPRSGSEWYILISDGAPVTDRIATSNDAFDFVDGLPLINFDPVPFGPDIYAQFGDEFALPVVGNFDPPATGSSVVDPIPGHTNQTQPLDVNNDGDITPIDALLIFNYLNSQGPGEVSSFNAESVYRDVTSDDSILPIDALMVLNHLNEEARLARAEAKAGDNIGRQAVAAISANRLREPTRNDRPVDEDATSIQDPLVVRPTDLAFSNGDLVETLNDGLERFSEHDLLAEEVDRIIDESDDLSEFLL